MKSYVYVYERQKNDRNGNPRHWIRIWRIKKGQAFALHDDKIAVGYRDPLQAVCEELTELENMRFSAQEIEHMKSLSYYRSHTPKELRISSGMSYDVARWRKEQGKIRIDQMY